MRLCRSLFARTQFWNRYVSRKRDEPSLRKRYDVFRGGREFKQTEFYYDENRPWTEGFKAKNMPGIRVQTVLVEPLAEWNVFKGDRVEILVGKDKGKQGIVNSVVKERNWVFVEGLNCKYTMEQQVTNVPPLCTKSEQPLLVTTQVKLIDPLDEQQADVEWRYTEEGERVRVSLRTGRIIPLPAGATEVDHFVVPRNYMENDVKDAKEADVTEITFQPKLCTFEEDINGEMGIKDDRKPAKTYWY